MLITALLLLQAPVAQGPVSASEGLSFTFPGDPQERIHSIFGRLQTDFHFFSGGSATQAALAKTFKDGNEVRRARIGMKGELSKNIVYKVEYDFNSSKSDLTDTYLELKGLGSGDLKIGHFKEPFGFNELTSSRFVTFLERSLPTLSFAPSRNVGVMYEGHDEATTWQVGVFRDSDKSGSSKATGQSWSATGRFVYRPWFEDEGEKLLHLGVAYSLRRTDGGHTFKAEPENHFLGSFFSYAAPTLDSYNLVGLEGAWVNGPVHVSGEYMTTALSDQTSFEPTLKGWYVQTGWFLTGEHRGYKTSAAAFERVKTKTNALDDGAGAWEIAARVSRVDFSAATPGNQLDDVSFALNWYLNSYTRMMLDYTTANWDANDTTNIVALRVAFDF